MHRCLSRFVPRASLSVRVPPAVPLSVPSCRSAAAASRLTHAHTTKRHNTQTAYNRNDEHDNPSSTATSSSSSSSVVLDADLSSDEDSLLARSYFPFGPPPPTTFPTANDGPLCRVGFGGTPRAGNNASDASAAVKSYLRLGGNFVDLTRGFSLDMIDAFKELIRLNKIQNEIILCASVSSGDLLTFLSHESDRFRDAQRRKGIFVPLDAPFESELLPKGIERPTTALELLPYVETILPKYLEYFLELHELDSIDVLLLEPPMLNLNPSTVPDSSYGHLGGVSRDFDSRRSFTGFLNTWFEALETNVVKHGHIKSYGLSTGRITYTKEGQHTTPWAFPFEEVIEAAERAAKNGKRHNLSCVRIPFSLFNAHHLLYPSASSSSSSSSSPFSSAGPTLFDVARCHGVLVLGDTPFDGSVPQHAEWVRFQEPNQSIGVREADKLMSKYRETMGKVIELETSFRSFYDELDASDRELLPPRIPHASWGHLIQTHQNDIYNLISFEQLLYTRLKPSLKHWSKLVKHPHPKVADWVRAYVKALPPLFQTFQQAIEHSTGMMNEKIHTRLVEVCPKLQEFKTLDEKTILILLSTPIDLILTDQTPSFDTFAQTIVRLYNEHPQQAATFGTPASADGSTAASSAPTITTVLAHYLLTPEELRRVLDVIQTEIAPLLNSAVMRDPLRKKKPATAI